MREKLHNFSLQVRKIESVQSEVNQDQIVSLRNIIKDYHKHSEDQVEWLDLKFKDFEKLFKDFEFKANS